MLQTSPFTLQLATSLFCYVSHNNQINCSEVCGFRIIKCQKVGNMVYYFFKKKIKTRMWEEEDEQSSPTSKLENNYEKV